MCMVEDGERYELWGFQAQQKEDKWIREKAEQEDGCDVSAGRLGQAQQKEGGK